MEAWRIPGVAPFALCLVLSKLVAYTFLYWLPFYLSHTGESETCSILHCGQVSNHYCRAKAQHEGWAYKLARAWKFSHFLSGSAELVLMADEIDCFDIDDSDYTNDNNDENDIDCDDHDDAGGCHGCDNILMTWRADASRSSSRGGSDAVSHFLNNDCSGFGATSVAFGFRKKALQ